MLRLRSKNFGHYGKIEMDPQLNQAKYVYTICNVCSENFLYSCGKSGSEEPVQAL